LQPSTTAARAAACSLPLPLPAPPPKASHRRQLQPARAAACSPSPYAPCPCETRRPSSTTWCSRRPRGVDGDLLKLRLDPNSGSFGARIGSRLRVTPLFLACSYWPELMVVFHPANVLAQVVCSCPRTSSCTGWHWQMFNRRKCFLLNSSKSINFFHFQF
jgi:hypothetical protein